jgi:flagellar biosynthesis protein FliR
MPYVFWIGLVIFGACLVVSFLVGVKSRTTATLTAVTIGAYLGLMAGFPLLALGLATS